MIDKTSVLKMTKDVFRKGQGFSDRRIMHPHREWVTGLLLFIVVVVAGAVFSAQVYLRYSDVNAFKSVAPAEVITYNEAAVANALQEYRNRTRLHEALTSRAVIFDVVPNETATSSENATPAVEYGEVDMVAE
jgi:hypothetical protein